MFIVDSCFTQVLISASKVDLKGPVTSPVAAVLLSQTDVQVSEKAKGRPRDKPDQAGRLPCYFYICSDYDDMKPGMTNNAGIGDADLRGWAKTEPE